MEKMLKPRIKELVRNTFFVTCGTILCAFILIPRISSFFLDLSFTVPLTGFKGHEELLRDSILMAAAFSVSGFLMALFISYFSRNREVILTLFAAVLVAVYYSIRIASVLLNADVSWGLLRWRILEVTAHMSSLVGSAVLGAWLIGKGRRKAELRGGNPAGEAESSE